jgi:UDPglucose 6-dehydrogenase
MRVTIFGTGYVGLVQAAVLADVGSDVVCVDVDESKIERLRRGELPMYEPGLEPLVAANAEAGRLTFTSDAAQGVAHGQVLFIAVGTPPGEDGSADLRHVLTVAETIGRHMTDDKVIVVKSTVPVGTGDKVRARIGAELKRRGLETVRFDVASNPEFLKEGSAVADCARPDRIIIGTEAEDTEALLRELYAPFNRNHEKIIVMDVRSAELTKYAANSMLAAKISFMNEIANLADVLGADVEKVRLGMGADPRIGFHFIYPGAGYGGSCFPKDVRALIRTAEDAGIEPAVLRSIEARNNRQKQFLFDKIAAHFGGELAGRTFALWGLAFKPNTDDMREAPSRALMERLWEAGAKVRAYDPKAMGECRRLYGERPDLLLCAAQNEALEGADALVVVTEWKSFQSPDFDRLRQLLKQPVIFDGRNIYDPAVLARHGITIYGVGRNSRPAANAPGRAETPVRIAGE